MVRSLTILRAVTYLIHNDVASHTVKHIPVYIDRDSVNVLNIENVQTYFIYVRYIAIFLLADQLKLRKVKFAVNRAQPKALLFFVFFSTLSLLWQVFGF